MNLACTDADLTSLWATPKFAKIVGRMDHVEAQLADSRQAKPVTNDIDLFWYACDDIVASDTAHAETIYASILIGAV